MTRRDPVSLTESARLLAIVRFRETCNLEDVVEALLAGGISMVEVTIDTPGALDAVRRAAGAGRIVGVGTVTSIEHVRRCVDAGARFVVSPGILNEVISASLELGIEPIPGTFTATEILRATSLGASAVKLFPASLGGPAYLRALRGPFPGIPFVPTGGIGPGEVGSYLAAGATCVGVGSEVTGRTAPATAADLDGIRARAAEAVAAVAGATNAGSP
jgi:2-dehydro-3-deoxyphosphogluconate aldolase / (4S)-4-hydroxy-2-oxoglutarate aldolase